MLLFLWWDDISELLWDVITAPAAVTFAAIENDAETMRWHWHTDITFYFTTTAITHVLEMKIQSNFMHVIVDAVFIIGFVLLMYVLFYFYTFTEQTKLKLYIYVQKYLLL